MKKYTLFSLMLLAAGSVLAADTDPKEQVTTAATALANQPNYSWTATVAAGNGGFRRGPTDGKTEKGGATLLTMSFNDNATTVVIQGTNAAIHSPDNGWQSAAEAAADNGGGGFNPGAFIARMALNYRAPAAEAADLAKQSVSLAAGTNGISGDLTEDGARTLLTFRRPGNGDGPTVTNAKGSVTFWIVDGQVAKYQVHVTGSVDFNGNTREVDRTTTTEIKDVGTTKVEVPEEARKKLE